MELISPKIRVLMLLDGQQVELEVQTDNRDAVQWDILRARKDWPKHSDASLLWMTVLAWHALQRTGQIKTMKVEEFIDNCLQLQPADAEGKPATVDPTQPVLDTGS